MSYSSVFGDELDALGVWWPRGDGTALRSAGQAWQLMADYLDDATAALDAAAGRVVEHHDGDAADAFTALWADWSGDPGHLQQTSADCRRLVRSLIDFAGDVDAADRTIAQLVELALGSLTAEPATAPAGGATSSPMTSNRSLLSLDGVWRQWLVDSAGAVGRGLAVCAHRTGADAAGCVVVAPSTPNEPGASVGRPEPVIGMRDIDLDLIDPDEIDWVDPGTPDDLSHLAGDTVDFGHGEGPIAEPVGPPTPDPTVPSPTVPSTPYPTAPYPTAPYPTAPYPGVPGLPGFDQPSANGPVTITVNGDGSVVNVVSGDNAHVSADTDIGSPTAGSGSSFAPTPLALPDAVPAVVPDVGDLGGGVAFSGGGGGRGGGAGGFGGFSSGAPLDLTPLDLPSSEFAESLEPAVRSLETLSLAPTDAVGLGGSSVPADAVPATSSGGSSRSSRMPMVPMMPMGGMGGGGSEDQEPRRRRMKAQ